MNFKLTFFLFISLLFQTCILLGQAGTLNDDFGINGRVVTQVGDFHDGLYDITILPDGKIIAAGFSVSTDTISDFSMVKYQADGSLDESFGNQGKVFLDFFGEDDYCYSIVRQVDGKIILAGRADRSPETMYALARFEADGTLDNTFGEAGKVVTDIFGGIDTGTSVIMQTDGKILLGGDNRPGDSDRSIAIVRYHTDGTVDTTFGVDGIAENKRGTGSYGIGLQSDGKIVSNGYIFNDTIFDPEVLDFAVFRFNTSGTIDSTFGTNGIGIANVRDFDRSEGLWIQSDDKILISGYSNFQDTTGGTARSSILRFKADGQLDSTFATDGIFTFDLENTLTLSLAITQQEDDKIIVTGRTANFISGIPGKLFVVRLLADGTLDATFGDEGVAVLDEGSETLLEGRTIAFNTNHTITAGGIIRDLNTEISNYFLAQFLSEMDVGTLDFSTKNNKVMVYPNPIMGAVTLKYELTQEDNISINLYHIDGTLIKSFVSQEQRSEGEHQEEFYINPNIPNGNYILSISNGSGQIGLKIIKQN